MATNPYVNKVEYGGTTLIDITDTTADDADVAEGKVYYKASGLRSVGTASGGGGGGSSWKHLAHEEYAVSTTSTSFVSVGTIHVGYEAINAANYLYVRVRDKAGAREGYYSGGDTFITNINGTTTSSGTMRFAPTYIRRNASAWGINTALSSSSYGIVPYTISKQSSNGALTGASIALRAKYSSTTSGTIDGTYEVDVFALATPIGYPTALAGHIDGKYRITIVSASNAATVDKTEAEAGETITVTIGSIVRSGDCNFYANIGEGGAYVAIAESPAEGQTCTFTMPESSVYIIAVLNQ